MEMETKKQNFSWPLLGSNFASVFGEGIYRFALNWFLVASFGNAKILGWLTGFGFVVFMICDLIVGILLDRYNRKMLLAGADLVGGIIILLLSFFLNPDNPQIWLLFAVTFVLNVDISFAYPAGRTLLPDVIKAHRVPRFNAMISMAFTLGQALGPMAGGVLLSLNWINFKDFLLIYSGLLILTAGINSLIKYHPEKATKNKQPMFKGIVEGYHYVFNTPKLLESMLLAMWSNFFSEGFVVATPYLVQKVYGGDAKIYSGMLSLAAIAGLVMGIWLARAPKFNRLQTLYLDLSILGVVYILAAVFPYLPVLTVLVIAAGAVRASVTIKINTVNQQESNPKFLGRVMSISFFSIDLWVPMIVILVGYMVEPFGSNILYIFGGLMLFGIWTIHWLIKHKKQTKLN
ncbi:MFS transporter [Weissella koreensis]|uniref:MFS transporter n=2 Tax=Weissella koreensis TaxID=165096 RepID=A0A7H1MNE0_9LACO|nr:MFS transporter [Weissella koreensis]